MRRRPAAHPQQKFVTVLFFDVEGSMALSAERSADEWWTVMESVFDLMCDAVHRFGGWVGNFTGDGIYAIFEDDGSGEGHALRACRAAAWLRARLAADAVEPGLELAVRAGINSGEVVMGTIGRRSHCLFATNGYAIGMAKRVESLALGGRIYVSDTTARLLAGACLLRPLGPVRVKGAADPVELFELLTTG